WDPRAPVGPSVTAVKAARAVRGGAAGVGGDGAVRAVVEPGGVGRRRARDAALAGVGDAVLALVVAHRDRRHRPQVRAVDVDAVGRVLLVRDGRSGGVAVLGQQVFDGAGRPGRRVDAVVL